jgi:hypothetical protein
MRTFHLGQQTGVDASLPGVSWGNSTQMLDQGSLPRWDGTINH